MEIERAVCHTNTNKAQLYFNLQIHPHWITRILYFFLFYILLYTCNTKWSYIHIYLYRLNNVLFLPFWSIITSLSIPFFVFKYVVFFVHFQRKIYSSPETILKVDCCQGKIKINFILKLYWKYSAFLEIIHKCFGFVKIKVKIKSHNNYVYTKIYNNIKVFWKKVLYLYLWNNPKKIEYNKV